jgi:peptidoglycan/xylan/chitin deacetylase (PgdA/CDA1 family)
MSRANVVLMHDTKGITRDALRNIIKTASSQGYTFSRIEMDTYMVRHGVNN